MTTDKKASRFFSIQFAVFGIVLLACAITWPIAHIVKGTLNLLGLIYSVAMLVGSIHLLKHGLRDLRHDFKKETNSNAK